MKKSEDIMKAEAERRSKDLYTVFNPTTEDMVVVLNSRISPEYWTIPAQEETIVPFYVAQMYADKMYDKIVFSKTEQLTIQENEKRINKGFDKMDYHTEQARFESRHIKNMGAKKEQIYKILIKGLYKEYGVGDDVPTPDKGFERKPVETTSDIDVVLGIAPRPTTPPVKVVNEPNPGDTTDIKPQPTRRELESQAKDLGIDTSKMTNKQQIIDAITEKQKNDTN